MNAGVRAFVRSAEAAVRNHPGPFIFMVAFAFRLVLFALDDGVVERTGDEPGYLAIAESLVHGTGFSLNGVEPTATRGPLYPLFVAGGVALRFPEVRTVQFLQIILDCITCLLILAIGRAIGGKTLGLAAGLLYSVYAPSALWCLAVMTETLFTLLVAAAVYMLAGRREEPGVSETAWAGFFIGLSTLTRPNGAVVAVVLFIVILAARRTRRNAAVFLAACALVAVPWIVRNERVFGRFIPTTTLTGLTLYNSYIPPEEGLGFNEVKQDILAEYQSIPTEAGRSDFLVRATIAHVRSHPLHALRLLPMKYALLIYPYDMRWNMPWSPIRFNPFWGIVACSAAFALAGMGPADRRRYRIVFAVLGAMLLTTFVFYGSPRLRAPFDPFFVLFAGAGIVRMAREKRFAAPATVVAANAVLFALGRIPGAMTLVGRMFWP